jgi:hypothetical protein
MEIQPTWHPYDGSTGVSRAALPDSVFAFPNERAEPLTDGAHVRSAIARFAQVAHVTDGEREVAFENIRAAADHYGVSLHATSWHDLIHG